MKKFHSSGIIYSIYEFLDVLRDANINISTDEVLTLFSAFPHIDISDKSLFKQALQTTLIKDYTDIPVFEKCFKEFFEKVGDITQNIKKFSSLNEKSPISEADIKLLDKSLNEFIEDTSEEDLFGKEAEDLLKIFLDETELTESSGGGMGMMLFQMRKSSPSAKSRNTSETDENRSGEFENIVINLMKRAISKRKVGKEIQNRDNYLLNKMLYQLTPEEIKEMREIIKRFGQKLKNRISLRKKRVKRGKIDIKRTIKKSLHYGGIPFKIFYKEKKIDRPQLIVICDVSGSVNQYNRFMLLLTHTLQSLFSKVRTFGFVSKMVEITPLFMEMEPERAINSIFLNTDFKYGWGSFYGKAFDEFISDFSDSLNKKTTILILGDARNNNNDPGLNSFLTMKEKVRNIIWLNPEKKHLWDWGDSIASIYRPHCIEMKEVNNFLDLTEFIDKLFDNIN